MAGANGSLQPNHTLNRLFTALDPKSLILSQFSDSQQKPNILKLTTESFIMERGPRYKAYADLRESKLRMKSTTQQHESNSNLTPPKKQVKFEGNFSATPNRRKGSSVLTQSVPDFSAVLRKENRKPVTMLPPLMEKSATPPAGSKSSKMYGVLGKQGGSKSANSGEKRSGGLMARKSYAYATVEELKGLSSAASNAINRENRGGRKTVLGYRQY